MSFKVLVLVLVIALSRHSTVALTWRRHGIYSDHVLWAKRGHVTPCNQCGVQGVDCLNQFDTMKDLGCFVAIHEIPAHVTLWCCSAASQELILLPLQFLSVVTLEGGLRVPIIMHPMPVSSVSGGDIFDCIQRGNIEECIHFVQSNRSILKQKGKLGRDTVQT